VNLLSSGDGRRYSAAMKFKAIALLLALTISIPVVSSAKTLKFPKKHPEFSVTFPNDWKAEITEAGIISAQPKGAAYAISFFAVEARDMAGAIEETRKEVEKRFTDVSSGDAVDFRNENGIKFSESDLTAKDKGSARTLSIVAFTIDRAGYYAMFQAGTPEADKQYTDQVAAILKSIAPAK
jgi:hypothetical protein